METNIRCPCRKYKNTKFRTLDEVSYHLCMQGFMRKYINWTSHGEESVQEYIEAAIVPPLSEEQTPTAHVERHYSHWGDEQHMHWVQWMIFYATMLSYFSSSHNGVPDDGTRSCPVDASPSSYYYGGGPYDYESGLADRFYNVVHASDQSLWNDCTES
ncbi:UNVERIFIED_CONTAM: hypothetical protein Sangu_3158500 [Sesamum angustifolium]|uniref:Transposase-associated domain-containing protein n=1 Tax=Sesamum angustifolium TaxID=2727405 RepID=A0AAW2JV17_9LAMI